MSLIERAKADIQTITSNSDEFGVEMTFSNVDDSSEATVKGIFSRHHMSIDEDGMQVIGRNAHVSVSEELLTAEGYPVRSAGEVDMMGHKVTVQDSSQLRTYKIKGQQPDETIGLLVFILGDYAAA